MRTVKFTWRSEKISDLNVFSVALQPTGAPSINSSTFTVILFNFPFVFSSSTTVLKMILKSSADGPSLSPALLSEKGEPRRQENKRHNKGLSISTVLTLNANRTDAASSQVWIESTWILLQISVSGEVGEHFINREQWPPSSAAEWIVKKPTLIVKEEIERAVSNCNQTMKDYLRHKQ